MKECHAMFPLERHSSLDFRPYLVHTITEHNLHKSNILLHMCVYIYIHLFTNNSSYLGLSIDMILNLSLPIKFFF